MAQHGEPLLIDDANLDPRGATIPGTDDVDESMLVVPDALRRARRSGSSRSRSSGSTSSTTTTCGLLTILADQAATAVESARLLARTQDLAGELRRLLDMSAELSESLDPRQVADLMAGHLAARDGRRRMRDQLLGPRRRAGRLARLLPAAPARARWSRTTTSRGYPETLRVLERQETVIIDADDPARRPGRGRAPRRATATAIARDAAARRQGPVDRARRALLAQTPITLGRRTGSQLARTMANEAAMALENARLYEDARNLADRDPLTGFYNHRFLHERLGEEVVRAAAGAAAR